MQKARKHIILSVLVAAAFTGCSLVDEDMRDCETDYQVQDQLRLVTNMTTELQTQLSLQTDLSLVTALKTYLKDVFTDNAHDIDLSFYDVVADSARLHHESHIMNASQSSYTLYIPVRQYMHIGLANLEENNQIMLENDVKCHTARLHQRVADTLSPHRRGIFTARLLMDVKEGVDQHFDVHLYMTNCATALGLDTLGSNVRDIKVFTSGFATDFDLADSTYRFQYTPVYRTDQLDLQDSSDSRLCFASVTFPSRTAEDTKVIIDVDDDDVTEEADKTLWQFRVYATLKNGSVTETLLSFRKPLLPGHFKYIGARIYENGTASPYDPSVGVSVTMDWTPGLEANVEF